MERPLDSRTQGRLLAAASAVVVVGALYFARDLLIPLLLAILAAFVLSPVATILARCIGRLPAVVAVVGLACVALCGLGVLVVVQANDLAVRLPAYRDNIEAKLHSLRGGALQLATAAWREIDGRTSGEAVAPGRAGGDGTGAAPPSGAPTPPVQFVAAPSSPLVHLVAAFSPLLGPLGTAGLVIVLMAFLLLERQSLKDRLVSLIGRDVIGLSTQVLEDARQRLARYLLMQSALNGAHGLCVGIGLWCFGVPNSVLWGLLATLLRFVPYVGPLIAAALPIAVSLAVFDGWGRPLAIVGFFASLELVSNNLLEPWLYGSSAGMSPLAVVVTATFWTWLWGTPGLVLATPLTICLVVASRHVPRLGFLNVLLGDLPGLEADIRFYQRLMELDQDGALLLAEEGLARGETAVAIYDAVIVPALAMVEMDRHADRLDARRARFFAPAVRQIAEELHDASARDRAVVSLPPADGPVVLCIPAVSDGDELAAGLLVRVLRDAGWRSEALSTAVLAGELAEVVERLGVDRVCISALPPQGLPSARYLCKRLRDRFPTLRIVVGAWTATGSLERVEARLGHGPDLRVVTTFADAVQELARWSARALPSPAAAAPPG